MNKNNPWLEITKQEEVNRPGLSGKVITLDVPTGWVAEQNRQFKNLILYGTTHPEALFQHPLTPKDCVEKEDEYSKDLNIIAEMEYDYEYLPSAKYQEKYFEYFSEMEMDDIEDMFDNNERPSDILEWVYEQGIWERPKDC